MEILLQFTVN